MTVLLAVVDAGSLSAGARRLGIPLTTVSRKVSDLEAHLRTRLLNRSSRQITPTDAGRSYVAACRSILEDVGEAERAAAGEYSAPRGELAITAPIVFGRLHVLPVVLDFLRAYPDIDVRLSLTDRPISFLEDHVDLAARIGAPPNSSLVATRVGVIRRMVCASPQYFAARGKPKRPEALAAHDCVTIEGLSAPDGWIFTKGKSEMAVAIHSRLVVNTAGRDRCRRRGSRDHARAVLSDRVGAARGRARHRVGEFRAAAVAGQSHLSGTRAAAAQIARLPGFRSARAQSKAVLKAAASGASRRFMPLLPPVDIAAWA